MNGDMLKIWFKSMNQDFPDEFNIRMHRAIQWYKRAEKEADDYDAQFIFLWISFNAAYAELFGVQNSERVNLKNFFTKVIAIDEDEKLHQLLFKEFTGVIRNLIQNQYVYEPFWRAMREHDSSESWKWSFESSKKAAMDSLFKHETVNVLTVIFDRLYILRNQLVHGGSTWNSKVNRQQVKDGADFMDKFVPLIIQLMVLSSEEDWGELTYPVLATK